jgi:hypothetical protein
MIFTVDRSLVLPTGNNHASPIIPLIQADGAGLESQISPASSRSRGYELAI